MTKLQPLEPFDVSVLPTSYIYEGTQHSFDFADLVPELQDTAEFFMNQGTLADKNSFGFVVYPHDFDGGEFDIDDPSTYVAFAGGWGPDKNQFIANAVRKLRFALREEAESLSAVHEPGSYQIDNLVTDVTEDGSVLWGDFPYGGATTVPFGNYTNTISSSVYHQDEDDLFSGHIGKRYGMAMHRADNS